MIFCKSKQILTFFLMGIAALQICRPSVAQSRETASKPSSWGRNADPSIALPSWAGGPPPGLSPEDKTLWLQSQCKWLTIGSKRFVGFVDKPLDVRKCFALARFNFITIDLRAHLPSEVKRQIRDSVVAIYDLRPGHQQVCHLIPRKQPYDDFTEKDLDQAFSGQPEALDRFIERLDHNVTLDCMIN